MGLLSGGADVRDVSRWMGHSKALDHPKRVHGDHQVQRHEDMVAMLEQYVLVKA